MRLQSEQSMFALESHGLSTMRYEHAAWAAILLCR